MTKLKSKLITIYCVLISFIVGVISAPYHAGEDSKGERDNFFRYRPYVKFVSKSNIDFKNTFSHLVTYHIILKSFITRFLSEFKSNRWKISVILNFNN